MTRRILAVMALLALSLPATAIAADPTTVAPAPPAVGGAWEIVAVQAGGTTLKVSGKLEIGPELYASVGCNSISARVTSFDGTHLVVGDGAMTQMLCPNVVDAETAIATVLSAGTLTLRGTTLTSTGGTITFASAEPPTPIDTAPPDSSGVDPTTCAALLGSEWNLGSTGTGSGSSVGSGGVTGSGSGTSGSGSSGSTNGGTVDGSGPVDGGSGGVAEPPGAIWSAVPVSPPDAGASDLPQPISVPPATAEPPVPASTDVPPPAPDDTAPPAPSAIAVPPIEPAPSAITPEPGATTPATEPGPTTAPIPQPLPFVSPGASMSPADACRALLATLKAGDGAAIPPGTAIEGGAPMAAQDASHAPVASTTTSIGGPLLIAGVGLVALVALLLGIRRVLTRRA